MERGYGGSPPETLQQSVPLLLYVEWIRIVKTEVTRILLHVVYSNFANIYLHLEPILTWLGWGQTAQPDTCDCPTTQSGPKMPPLLQTASAALQQCRTSLWDQHALMTTAFSTSRTRYVWNTSGWKQSTSTKKIEWFAMRYKPDKIRSRCTGLCVRLVWH